MHAHAKVHLLLLHGYHRTASDMETLAQEFRLAGFQVLIPPLPSNTHRLWECTAVIEDFLKQCGENIQQLHVVGHSYGGLMARALLSNGNWPIASIHCVGSSHQGTILADILRFFGAHRKEPSILEFCRPGPEIPPPRQWPRVVQLIAGTRNALWWGRFFLPAASDGRLPLTSALAHGFRFTEFPPHTLRTPLPLDHHRLMDHASVAHAVMQAIGEQ